MAVVDGRGNTSEESNDVSEENVLLLGIYFLSPLVEYCYNASNE